MSYKTTTTTAVNSRGLCLNGPCAVSVWGGPGGIILVFGDIHGSNAGFKEGVPHIAAVMRHLNIRGGGARLCILVESPLRDPRVSLIRQRMGPGHSPLARVQRAFARCWWPREGGTKSPPAWCPHYTAPLDIRQYSTPYCRGTSGVTRGPLSFINFFWYLRDNDLTADLQTHFQTFMKSYGSAESVLRLSMDMLTARNMDSHSAVVGPWLADALCFPNKGCAHYLAQKGKHVCPSLLKRLVDHTQSEVASGALKDYAIVSAAAIANPTKNTIHAVETCWFLAENAWFDHNCLIEMQVAMQHGPRTITVVYAGNQHRKKIDEWLATVRGPLSLVWTSADCERSLSNARKRSKHEPNNRENDRQSSGRCLCLSGAVMQQMAEMVADYNTSKLSLCAKPAK